MPGRPYNLAIETSGRAGSVTLGRGDELIATEELGEPKRHTVHLVPAIDRLCQRHSLTPRQLGEVYLSIGPGSFTGLRIGVTTAKLFAQVLGVRLVAVPTLDAVVQNVPPESGRDGGCVAVCLNLKRDRAWTGLYRHEGGRWIACREPGLLTMAELLESSPRPLSIVGDPLPDGPGTANSGDAIGPTVCVLPGELAAARSDAVWTLGREAAKRGEFADPLKLLPLYVRPPEAEELWAKRLAEVESGRP